MLKSLPQVVRSVDQYNAGSRGVTLLVRGPVGGPTKVCGTQWFR